ncbi:hypothetical protein [Lacipirellula sp.]|uniref:hypothetical protein n=1 Tax=Lacipirellula sp. TaxID=2691419 RepID=UPI003D0B8080
METISAPAPRRLISRLIPWTLASGVFAGGGFGVYHFAVPATAPRGDQQAVEAVDPFAAPAASGQSEQIKQLFAAAPESAAYPTDAPSNRYAAAPTSAPQAPAVAPDADEVDTPRSAAELAPAQNPFAAAAPVDMTPNAAEVTRGQEPGPNKLRTASHTAPVSETPAPSAEAAASSTPVAFSSNPFSSGGRYGEAAPAPAPAPEASAAAANAAAAFGPAETTPAPHEPTLAETPAPAATPIPAEFQPQPAPEMQSYHADAPTPAAVAAAEPTMAAPPANPFGAQGAAPMEVASRSEPSFANEVSQSANQLRAQHHAAASAAVEQPAAQHPATLEPSADITPTPTPGLAAADGSGQPGSRDLEGLQSPAITIQKQTPTEIQVGRPCNFAVRVQNNSKQTVQGVQVHDEVPLGTQLVGTAPKAQVAGSRVQWDLGAMAPGEERIVEMQLLPKTEGELGSVATVTFAAQASAKVRCTKPELALRLTAPPRVMAGEKQLVQIEVSNPGSGEATGVMLLETIPTGVSHEAGPALEFEVGSLLPGASKQLDLLLSAEEAGRIVNTMTARADANLEVQASCEFEVVAPELKVSIDGPKMRYLDRPATYTVNIENPGTASAKELQLITQLPPGLKFKEANNHGEYDAKTNSVHWSLAELPANERGAVQLTVLPVEPGQHPLQVATRADRGLEDRTETSLTVEGLVALSFEVKATEGAVEVGRDTSYEITVVNQGSKAAANVQVQVVMPQGLRGVAGNGATQSQVLQDRIAFAPIPQLAPRAEAKFRVQVQGLQAGDQRAKIMVLADEVTEPITKEQSTRVYSDQ